MSERPPSVSEQLVETLLRRRYGPAPAECPGLEQVAAALSFPEDEGVRARASEHLASCAVCRESLLALEGSRSVPEPVAAASLWERISNWRHAPSFRVRLAWATAGMAAALLGVGLHHRATSPDMLVPKGSEHAFHIAVQRGASRFRLGPGEALQSGDRLGFFYSAPDASHLVVLDVEADGKAAALFPAGGRESARVLAGEGVGLPDGAIVRDGEGCEWIVAVFADAPLPVAEVREALGDAARLASSDCSLAPELPWARKVVTLTVRH